MGKQETAQKKMDMLNGPIWNKLIQYALPVAATGILEQLLNVPDEIFPYALLYIHGSIPAEPGHDSTADFLCGSVLQAVAEIIGIIKKCLPGMEAVSIRTGTFSFRQKNDLQPPFRCQIAECYYAVTSVIHHNFDVSIMIRHNLCHEFAAGSAWRNGISIAVDCDHAAEIIFSVGDHIENCISLRAHAESACRIDTDTDINLPTARFHGSRHAA